MLRHCSECGSYTELSPCGHCGRGLTPIQTMTFWENHLGWKAVPFKFQMEIGAFRVTVAVVRLLEGQTKLTNVLRFASINGREDGREIRKLEINYLMDSLDAKCFAEHFVCVIPKHLFAIYELNKFERRIILAVQEAQLFQVGL
jgi:hypothetical protein